MLDATLLVQPKHYNTWPPFSIWPAVGSYLHLGLPTPQPECYVDTAFLINIAPYDLIQSKGATAQLRL